MNGNDIITLAPNVTIKYIDNILVGGKNYYKYEAKVNDNQKNLYLNKKIGNDSKQKNDVYKFILNNENNDSTDIFLDLDIKSDVTSTDSGGNVGDVSVQKSRNQNPKLSENWVDYIDNALTSIRNTSNCSIGVIENFFNKESSISGKYKYIDDNMAESKNLYNKMLNSGKGGSGDLSGMVTNYRDTFNDIAYVILEMYDAAQTKAINSDELKMMDDKSKEYFGTESFNNEFKNILSNSKLELKKTNNNFLFKDMFKEIGALQAKYSVASLSENESIFKSISNSIDDNIDEDMKGKVDELVKFMAGFLGISELEARNAIKENPIEMANQLYDAQMSIAENVKNGGSGYDAPEISTGFWEFKDAFYSTDAGKEALFNRFLNSNSDVEGEFPKNITPYDEKNSIAYTNYITYCMQIGKLNWLMDSCKEFPVVIDKINNNDVFTVPEEVTDTNTLSYIAKNIEDYNVAPFGYVKKGDKWYQVNYNKRGQDMLYYMDYHCGENSGNSGDDRVITAFSNQGRVDSVERNYKGLWIDSHLNGDYDKNSSEYKSAERDYYVLNGVIEDKKRYNELTESGEFSFKDLVKYSGLSDSEKDKLADINYINEHKDEIKETMDLSEKQLYNFSVLFSTEGINTGDIVMDPMLESLKVALSTIGSAVTQFGGGLFKFFENVGDAANTAIHSDFVLGSVEYDYTDWDGTSEPNAKFDLTKEFKEFRDSTWKDFYESEKYNEEFSSFKDSVVGIRQLESKLYNDYYQFDGNTDGYYYVNGKIYKSVDEIPDYVKENAFADLFKQNKLKEWNFKDTSSSNFYLAAFKEGIREGGNFTRFDNLSDKVVENAKIQFKAQEEVEVDKTGEWMESNIYNTDFYKNMEDYSFVKKDNILGMMFNQVGNMAVPIAISMIPGMFGASASALGTAVASSAQAFQGLSSAALFASAFGGAAEEAFISGASYNEAFKYATLSATTELAIEHVFSGIGGYGEGWLDDVLEYLPNKFFASTGLDTNLTAQTLKTLITGGLGEAVEEVTTDFVTPLWQSMTYMNDKTYYDVLNENVSLGSLAQTALVSFLSSMIFKGVEINQQTSAFNKNFTNLQNRISTISDFNLDSNILETQAKKVLAQYVGGIIENEGVIKSGLLEQLIKNASNQLVSDPKSREQLSKLQDELVSFKNQEVTIGEGKNSINVTGSELLKLEDYSGFDGKYTIEDGKIKFEDEKTQSRFNSSILDLAQKQIDSYNSSLKELVMEFQSSKDSVNANNKVKNLQDAISTIIEYDNNKFNTNDLVFFEYNGEILLIPKSIATATTTKLSIEEGKISFKKDMNSDKFIEKLYDKAIGLCNEQIRKNTYDINKIINKGLVNKAIDIIKPSLENSIPSILITGIMQTEKDNLTKIDVEATINGEQKNINVYIDGNTDSSVYKQGNKLTNLIQKTIMKKENSDLNNIYLGELVYDSKTKEMNIIEDTANALYVQSLELETNKSSRNMGQLQNVINSLTKINGNLESLEIVTIQKEGKNVLISKSLLDEITSKYKIVDGKVEFTKDMSVDKFISAVYDKAINLNNQTILGMQNTNIKNSTYVDADGMDLYRLEVETIIDGKTRTVNVYVDGNTDIASIKDSSKISEKLYQLITQNKNSENIYAGNIKYNEKTGSINATYNEANKLYVDGLNKTSESNSSIDAVVNDETAKSEKMDSDNAKSGDIKKGESYEYSVEEINEDDSTIKPKETVEAKEKPANTGSESVITNVAQTASVAATAGATSQAIYQNNGETSSAKDTSKAKNISSKSNTQVKENAHVETNNNSIINISEIKSQINSYIDSIKTECEKYIEMHQNDENFEHRFEQFKRDKIMELNDKLSEVRKTIIDSNNAELNAINEKINSLSENDSLRDELISERDKLIEKQQQELSNIATSANEKLQKVFSELVVNTSIAIKNEMLTEMFGSLELSKEFVSALTTEQKDFLTQISSEQGLIEYLQNNPLTKVDLLERSELANTDNKYVNKLIQLISENQGTTKQIYNVMDVVKNNSTPILVDSSYKGDTHTLSTNEVLDFMKTRKVDTKYSYSDYVKATNTLMNDIASQNASIDINEDVFNGISMYNEISGYLDGSSNFTALYNLNIIEKCNKFYEFISKNNISLDSAVMEKLDFISKLEENKTIANLNDYFNGKSPIVMDKYIRVYGREISTQSLIDLVEMKSPNYLILLRDYKISSIPNSERFIITSAIDKLMSSNTDLAEYYKSNYEKFNNLYQNKYVLKNSYILVPSTFGEYPTKYIDHVLHNPYAISIYDGMERQQIISTVNAFTKYLDENNLSSYYSSSKLDFLNRKVVDIDSSVSYTTELLKMFDTNGESFGANQGAVRELIIRLKMNDAVQSIFGNKIETKDFMETLNNMNFTEEQFKNALLTVNANNLLPLGDIEMLNTLIEQVVDNYPGMSKKDALQFLYLLESKEAGGSGICNYASMVNLIFDKYKNNIDLFEKHFGYPMYLTINGKEQLNTTRLLVDMYSTINEGLLVTKENGTYKVATSSKAYRNLTRDFYGDISKENFERFLTKKGIKFNINEKFTYSTVDPDNMFHYEEIITSVRESLAKGEHVHLTSMNFSLYNLDGSIFNYDIEPHIMSVVGINEDGKLLVDSWGKKLLFDLREELARLTNDDLSLDALKIKHYTTIVSYDISLDNNSNHSTSLDIKTDVNKERNTYNGSYTEVFDEPSSSIKSNVTSSVITKEDLEFIDEGIDTKDALASKTSTQDDLRNVGNASNTVINDSKLDRFDIVIDGQVENTLKIDELVRSGSKISDCYELMEESQYDEFNSAVVNYIDYVKENNISVDIDSNVMKFYESYKYAKENNVFIVNEDRILEKGADMIAIPQEIHNKYKNDLIYQEIVDTIIESVQSLENFEKFISIHYLSNDMYMIYMNDVINCIEPSIKANENFNAMSNVISKLNEYAIKDFGLFLSNIHEMIYENANPVYLPYYINDEFKNGHQAISTSILLDTILGKNQFPSSYNSNIIENCRVLYNYLQSNNITLNENIMEKLEFVNSLNEDQIILNVSEYFEGKSPIVTTEFIYLQDAQISSLDIMKILKMDSDAYIKLLRDGTCEFKDIKSNNLILSIQRLLSQNQILREQYNENYIKLKDLYSNNYVLKNTLTIVPKTFKGYYTSLIDNILNNPNTINAYSISEKHNLVIAINDFIEYLKSNNIEIEYHEYEKVLEFLNRNVPNIDSSIAIKSEFALELETNVKNGGAFGSDQGIIRALFKKVNMNTVIEKIFGNNVETKELLEVLNQMNISDEEFTRQLLKTNRGLLFAKNTTEIKMIEDLANQVMKNYPGMGKKEAIQFLYLMETEEAGGTGICNYASLVNLIFNKYMSNPSLFEEKLGYPMYVIIDGKRQLNTATLLVDLYSIINDGVLVTKENGVYKVNTSNENYLNLSDNGKLAIEYFQKFLDKKGIDMKVKESFAYSSIRDLMHYEEVITNIHESIAKGEHVHIAARYFDICYPNGNFAYRGVGGHIMSVLEITKEGHLIVDSWGKRLMIDLKTQMSNLGDYNSYANIRIVSYDISSDNASNISTSLDINTDVNNERNIYNGSYTEVFDVPSDSIKSNVTSSMITDEDLEFLDEGFETRDAEAPMTSAQSVQSDVYSDVSNIINIDGVEITVETLKQLQTQSNLETALKTGEYAGVRIEKALVELSKLDGVTLDSKLQQLVKISETLRQDEIIFNIKDVYSNDGTANIINIDVYKEFMKLNPNSSISLDDLYEIINSNSVIYRLISNDTIIKNVSNESIKESLSYLVSISNRYNYDNKVIREIQYLLNLLEDNYTTEELYDAFAIAHTEFNTSDVYYECSNYLKTMDVDSAVKLLESKGYTTLDITDSFLNLAIRMDSQELSKTYYYKAFDYLVEHGIDEKEAATLVRDKYRTLLYRRGTRVVTTTPNGVKIRVVNNISTNNKLFTIEKIESMIKQAEKYYAKTGLKEIVIFDSFAPHNIYSEKVQYEDYVKTHNNRRFVAAASATKSSILLWEDFNKLDSIVHEYGHTIDKHIKLVNKLATDFSSSSTWLEAIQKDTVITSKRVSEYAYASNGEDFAEFLKHFNRNPLEVARKYPNRYKAASKYLNLDIDSNIIERYLDSKQVFIQGIEELSNLLTEDGSMLEFIKQYVFENLKGDNSIAKIVISNLDAIYESKLDIIEDYGLYSLFIDMSEQERIGSHEFIKIMKDYLDGKDISSKFKDSRNLEIIELLEKEEIQEWYEEELNEMTAETEKISVSDEDFEKLLNGISNDSKSNSSSDTSIVNDGKSLYNDSIIEDADVDMAFPKKSIFSKRIETVSVSDIPRVFRNMNTSDIISILEGKTTLMNDENYINNKKSIIRFVKYLSENNIKLSLNERANTIIENLRNGDFKLNILNFSDVLNGDAPIYGPSSISLDGIKISTDDVMAYLENKKNEISSIITSETPNEDARDLLNAIDELGNKNDIIYDKYRKSIKLIERIERSYVYKSYDSYYLLPKSFNGIDTSNILNSDMLSLVSYINSLSNADKKSYRVALDEFGKYIYKTNTRLSKQDLSRVNKLYDVINTKKFSTNTIIKSKIYDSFEMSYQNDGEFGSNQGKVREVIEKLGITNVIQSLFDEKVERSKFLQTLSEFNISERDFINALNRKNQSIIMNSVFIDGDINFELFNSLIDQVKMNYPNMSTMEAVRFLYLIETKEAAGPGICNNPILVNMIFDRYVGKENIFERDFGYPMYIKANNGKKVLNEARLLVDIFSTLNDGVLVHNVNGNYVINTTSVNYVRAYDLNGLRLDAVEKFINKKGININVSKSYFFNSNDELIHYDYLMEQIKSELSKGNYVIFGGKGFDMDVESFEFREDCDAHGMTIVGIDTNGELILDSWGMKARVDLKKELSRLNTMFKDRNSNMVERIFTISSYNIN